MFLTLSIYLRIKLQYGKRKTVQTKKIVECYLFNDFISKYYEML